jgi:hypothetical protein
VTVSAPTTAVVRVSADIKVSGSSNDPLIVDTVLTYSVREPFEVTIAFQNAKGTPSVVWRFARDLLVEARVEGEAGEGDVRIMWDDDVILQLHGNTDDSPTVAWVSLPGRRIGSFLSRITSMVPLGSESRLVSVPDLMPADW